MFKRLLGAFTALLALCLTGWGSWYYGNKAGIAQGIDMYHQMCYTYGGYIVDQPSGTVVQCAPLTQIPEAERKKFLDKGREMV